MSSPSTNSSSHSSLCCASCKSTEDISTILPKDDKFNIYRYCDPSKQCMDHVILCSKCKLELQETWTCYVCQTGQIDRKHDFTVVMQKLNFTSIALLCNNPDCYVYTSIEAQTHFGQELHLACAQCFKMDPGFKCSKCKFVSYCNRECQTLHWPIHKLGCKKRK